MAQSKRSFEIHTLHFSLFHAPAGVQHTLHVGTDTYPLTAHTPETLARHAAGNPVLASMATPEKSVSHFAEGVRLPSDAIVLTRVQHPSKDPQSPLPAMSLMSLHIPAAGRAQAKAANPQAHAAMVSKKMVVLGAAPPAPSEASDTSGDASDDGSDYVNSFQTPADAAHALTAMHPELMHFDPATAAHIQNNHIATAPGIDDLALALSAQGPADTDGGWATISPCVDVSGNQLNDADGKPVYRYKLSDQTREAVGTPVRGALRSSKDDLALQNKTWSISYGTTSVDHSAPPPSNGPKLQLKSSAPGSLAAPTPPTNSDEAAYKPTDWTSVFGLDLNKDTLKVGNDGSFSLEVTNTAFRHMDTCVDFLDDQGNVISDSFTKLVLLPPANFFMGIPLPTSSVTLSFTFPQGASGARVYFGTLGTGKCDYIKDRDGIIYTACFEFGVPMLLLVAGAMIEDTDAYQAVMKDKGIQFALATVGAFLISPAFAVQISANPVKGAIALANAVGPMMVSKGMPALASFILRTEAENKAIDAVPIIGWIFELVSLAATAAQILETTVATLATPATTSIDVVRTMNLTVDVNPDPVHSVWPSTSYYYRIMVQYRGGTFQHVDGEMSTITHGVTSSALLEKVFNGVPAGGSLMVYAVIYSQNYWICGYAASNWMDATPDSSGNLKVTLNITEQLVPLSKDTQYSHMEKLTYASPGGHQWTAGAAPTATATSLQDVDTGHNLAALGGITINDRAHMLGYSWRASGQSLPLSGSTTPTPANGQMSAFQNISYLAQPEAALKSSNVGYTGMQRIAYDQFGPLEKDASGTGYNFFLDAQSDGTHLRSVAMDDTTAFDLSGTKSWGKFSQANLDAVVVHPGGYVIAVSWENSKMEILTIPSASSADADAPTATLVSGQGARDGLMHGPVALAVTPDGKVLVLEGTNQRIQAFDTKGNPVRAFTDPVGGRAMQATIALKKQTQAVTYLDMGTESKGYIYVLYYLGKGDVVSDYNLDIYDPEGNFLSTTNGLNAAKFVVSMWRDVYGLNYEVLLGPGSRTEPSVSHWIPSTPPGVQP